MKKEANKIDEVISLDIEGTSKGQLMMEQYLFSDKRGLSYVAVTIFITLSLMSGRAAWALPSIENLLEHSSVPVLEIPPDPEDPEDDGPKFPSLPGTRSAIVIDNATGKVLGSRLSDLRRPMASTTKIMTGLLVVEAISQGAVSLDTIVVVSNYAGTMSDRNQGRRSGGSIMGDLTGGDQDTSVGLSPGDTVSIRDLLYGLLLDSGNDAALALAEAIAGTEMVFVDMMNNRASQLGLGDTWFANPHGRDPQRIRTDCPEIDFYNPSDWGCAHFTTATDLGRLAWIALQQPLFAMIVNTPVYYYLDWSPRNPGMVDDRFDNSNKMIRDDREDNDYVYPGAFGVKTGTTDRAGFCLVSGADSQDNTADSVIAVLLGANSEDLRYQNSAALLDYGFEVLAQPGNPQNPYTQFPNVTQKLKLKP